MVIFGGTSGSVRAPAAGLAAADIVSRETTNQPDSISAKVKLKGLPWCRLSVRNSSANAAVWFARSYRLLIVLISNLNNQFKSLKSSFKGSFFIFAVAPSRSSRSSFRRNDWLEDAFRPISVARSFETRRYFIFTAVNYGRGYGLSKKEFDGAMARHVTAINLVTLLISVKKILFIFNDMFR